MKRLLTCSCCVVLVSLWAMRLSAQETTADSPGPAAAGSPTPATSPAAEETKYLLRYQFSEGEKVRWEVTHLATTETQIQGNTQSSKSRSVSTKVWQIDSISDEGNITFTHSVENVDMWQKLSDRPEVRYNSAEDEEVPSEYEQVAKTIGVPLTSVTISAEGRLIERDSRGGQTNFGLGDIVMLLPPKPVQAGSKWHEPAEIQLREPSQRMKRIKIRKLYTLKKVQTGVASIEVKTEVLTPIRDASLKAQLVQQIADGTVKFDVDAGRVISRQMDWDETVIGFNGNDSLMEYQARFKEKLLPATPRTARRK